MQTETIQRKDEHSKHMSSPKGHAHPVLKEGPGKKMGVPFFLKGVSSTMMPIQRQPMEEEEDLLHPEPESTLQLQPLEEEEELLQPKTEEGSIRRQPIEEEEDELLQTSSEIQTKLTVGPDRDEYEREADRVPDEVMRMPVSDSTPAEKEEQNDEPLKPSTSIQMAKSEVLKVQCKPPDGVEAPRLLHYGGVNLVANADRCYEILEAKQAELGEAGMNTWAANCLAMSDLEHMGNNLGVEVEVVQNVKSALQAAQNKLNSDNDQFIKAYKKTAEDTVRDLLHNSREKITAELEKVGEQGAPLSPGEGGVEGRGHSAGPNVDYLSAMRAAAFELAARRREVDILRSASADALQKLGKARGDDPFDVDRSAKDNYNQAHKKWQAAELEYKSFADSKIAAYPTIAAFATGGNSAASLEALANKSDEDLSYDIHSVLNKKLENIDTVLGEIGGRFSIWKQRSILAMTNQQMNATPAQQRLVKDTAKQISADKESDKMFWSILAIGLGLLAAVPTGGSSLLALAAGAAAVTGAAIGAYQTYEAAQDYLLESAAANTALDRADSIAEEDPDYFWLALDICTVIADLVAAGAAFRAIRAAMKSAKSAGIKGIPALVHTMRSIGVSGSAQGRVIREVLPAGGDIGKALAEIRAAFKVAAKGDNLYGRVFNKMADKVLTEGRVVVLPERGWEEVARWKAKTRWPNDPEKQRMFMVTVRKEMTKGYDGWYHPWTEMIVIKGGQSREAAASVLMHELTHRFQDLRGELSEFLSYQNEMQSFLAQRAFLEILPPNVIPSDSAKLLTMSKEQIGKHVLEKYPDAYKWQGMDDTDIAARLWEMLRDETNRF